jgi:hypothetical protein
VRRKAEVTYGVCPAHRTRRRIFIAVGWFGFVLSILLIAFNPILGISGVLAALLAGFIGSRLVYPRKITKEEVRLAGCGEAFLASLEDDAKPAPAFGGLIPCPKCRALKPADAPSCLKCQAAFA